MSVDLLKVSNLSVEYKIGPLTIPALDRVSFTIPSKGYSLGIVGESGSGKTTLATSIMNAIEPPGKITVGVVAYNGKNILAMTRQELLRYRWEKVAMIYQSAMNSLNPVKSVRDPIQEVLQTHMRMPKDVARKQAENLLSQVGIKPERVLDYPHEFSGGMKQRVVIALALALGPELLIADEPTSALDVVTAARILTLIKNEVKEKHRSLIFITHEITILRGLVENIALMYAGEIVELGPIEPVLQHPLHPYTEMLLGTLLTMESTPDLLSRKDGREEEKGNVASTGGETENALVPLLTKVGCKYRDRCPYAFERCQVEKPKLVEVEKGRWVACHKYA